MAKNTYQLNYEKICRTCMIEGDLKPIFDQNTSLNLAEKIFSCATVQVQINDGYPSNICDDCILQINQAYAFQRKCQETNLKLQNIKLESISELNPNNFESELETEDPLLKTKTKYYLEDLNVTTFPYGKENDLDKNNQKTELKEQENHEKSNDCSKNASQDLSLNLCCEKCDISFLTKSTYKKHMSSHSAIKRVVCEICSKQVSQKYLYRHMQVHKQGKSYVCYICDKSFSYSCNLNRHLKIHTGEKPYTCSICNHGFIQAVTLEAHLRTHTGETPFLCTYCGKGFKQARLCRLHVQKTHINPISTRSSPTRNRKKSEKKTSRDHTEQQFGCELRNRRTTKSKIHLLQHKEKSLLCSECGKRFASKVALNLHSMVHSGKKPYECEICQKTFAYTSSLRIHKLTHTGEKPHKCQICHKNFTQKIHLRTHLRLHDGLRPHDCWVCSKSFALKGNLTVHMRTHTGETPFICPVCGKGFHDSSSRRKHQKIHLKKK